MAGSGPTLEYVLQHPIWTLLSAIVIAVLSTRVYNIFFHPCANFPGPWTRAAFQWPHHWAQLKGVGPSSLLELHDKYGPVVRTSPDRLSFNRATAYKDIYGFRSDRSQIPKDYKRVPVGAKDYLPLFASDDADHTRLRRVVAHAFSETALREQESLVQGHINRWNNELIQKSKNPEEEPDLDQWLDWLSFDILSDLTYGESFDSVKDQKPHQFILDCYQGCQMTPAALMAWDYTIVDWLFKGLFYLKSLSEAKSGTTSVVTDDKVEKRIKLGADARKDFMTYIIRNNEKEGKQAVTIGEIRGMTTGFMAAGGEEPSSLMASLLYYLLQNADMLKRVQDELREVYTSTDEINFANAEKPEYFNAVIRETLRIRPPSAGHFSRRTNVETVIDGFVVPPNAAVEVAAYATCNSARNFTEPQTFAPERWLPNKPAKFNNDDRDALVPFMLGPRACLGKNIAMAVIRCGLASFLWHFDIAMVDPNQNWLDQQFRTIWHRPGLKLKLTLRRT